MKQIEKQRLITLTRDAVGRITGCHPKIKEYADRAAEKYSPTNASRYRTLAEIVWWLIAVDSHVAAIGLLDALCAVDDDSYWTPHALASAFATRAWLHANRNRPTAARSDACDTFRWVQRDVNFRAITASEARGTLERFDGWLSRAIGERGVVTALHVLSHGMRVLVMYQQLGKGGDAAAKAISSREYTTRLNAGLSEMRRRIERW